MFKIKTKSFLYFAGIIWLAVLNLSCGTLGGFDEISFPTTKSNVVNAIDTLYARNPKYVIPTKWEVYNDWNKRGYDFLDSRIFYFSSSPEEMYYVSFVRTEHSDEVTIAIRAVFNPVSKWMLEGSTERSEKRRIIKRFKDEIVCKLEVYTNKTANQ